MAHAGSKLPLVQPVPLTVRLAEISTVDAEITQGILALTVLVQVHLLLVADVLLGGRAQGRGLGRNLREHQATVRTGQRGLADLDPREELQLVLGLGVLEPHLKAVPVLHGHSGQALGPAAVVPAAPLVAAHRPAEITGLDRLLAVALGPQGLARALTLAILRSRQLDLVRSHLQDPLKHVNGHCGQAVGQAGGPLVGVVPVAHGVVLAEELAGGEPLAVPKLLGVVGLGLAEPSGSLLGELLASDRFAELILPSRVPAGAVLARVGSVSSAALAAASHDTSVRGGVQHGHIQAFVQQLADASRNSIELGLLVDLLAVALEPTRGQALLGVEGHVLGQDRVSPSTHALDGPRPALNIHPGVVRLEALHGAGIFLRSDVILEVRGVRFEADNLHVHLIGHLGGVALLGLLELNARGIQGLEARSLVVTQEIDHIIDLRQLAREPSIAPLPTLLGAIANVADAVAELLQVGAADAMGVLAALVVVPALGALLTQQVGGADVSVLLLLQLRPLQAAAQEPLDPVVLHPRHRSGGPDTLGVKRLGDPLAELGLLGLELVDVGSAELLAGHAVVHLVHPGSLVGLPLLEADDDVVVALQGLHIEPVQVGQLHGRGRGNLPPSASRADELEIRRAAHLIEFEEDQLHNAPDHGQGGVGREIRVPVPSSQQHPLQEGVVGPVALPALVEVVGGDKILLEPAGEAQRVHPREDAVGDGGQHVGEGLEPLVGAHAEVDAGAEVGGDELRQGKIRHSQPPIHFHGVLRVHGLQGVGGILPPHTHIEPGGGRQAARSSHHGPHEREISDVVVGEINGLLHASVPDQDVRGRSAQGQVGDHITAVLAEAQTLQEPPELALHGPEHVVDVVLPGLHSSVVEALRALLLIVILLQAVLLHQLDGVARGVLGSLGLLLRITALNPLGHIGSHRLDILVSHLAVRRLLQPVLGHVGGASLQALLPLLIGLLDVPGNPLAEVAGHEVVEVPPCPALGVLKQHVLGHKVELLVKVSVGGSSGQRRVELGIPGARDGRGIGVVLIQLLARVVQRQRTQAFHTRLPAFSHATLLLRGRGKSKNHRARFCAGDVDLRGGRRIRLRHPANIHKRRGGRRCLRSPLNHLQGHRRHGVILDHILGGLGVGVELDVRLQRLHVAAGSAATLLREHRAADIGLHEGVVVISGHDATPELLAHVLRRLRGGFLTLELP
mmetsp:Transcript_41044/g.93644  ORF Transcript_41044/g.93644 Transcript_41044/m.93644 type:complete len:1191 (-) Transcript_41044:162-3734(-)